MNGQDKADQSYEAFRKWASSKTDADFREIVRGAQLNRGEICRECGFGRSALTQNPRIKEALFHLEDDLRERGVLPWQQAPVAEAPMRAKGQMVAASDTERLRKLEAEVAGLKAALDEARGRLTRYEAIEGVLAQSGRLVR
jgi:hypothetical protein